MADQKENSLEALVGLDLGQAQTYLDTHVVMNEEGLERVTRVRMVEENGSDRISFYFLIDMNVCVCKCLYLCTHICIQEIV